jgi:hypothetical protein
VGGLAQQVAQIACLAALAAVGVRRVSVGGALARATWTAFEDMAERLWTQGRLPQYPNAAPPGTRPGVRAWTAPRAGPPSGGAVQDVSSSEQ